MRKKLMKMETAVAYGQSKEVGVYAFASVVNALAAYGITNISVQIRILIPVYAFKSRMHTMEKIMKKVCEGRGIYLQDVKTERSNVINQTMVIVTGHENSADICFAGTEMYSCIDSQLNEDKTHLNGQDIVLTKWIGMEGMLRILEEKEAELKQRFSTSFLKQISMYKSQVFATKEIEIARQNNVSSIRQVGDGGVFAALWELAKQTGCGLEVDMKKIPVLQETVEICEFFRMNPYQLTSTGTMIMVTADGEKLVEILGEQGIPAAMIGKLTDNNDKILRNGEEIRYIDRPAPDEIMKLFEA